MARVAGFEQGGDVAESVIDRLTEQALLAAGLSSRAEAEGLIDEVLRLAEEWRAGRLPLIEIRRLTTPRDRFLAARFVRPQPAALKGLLDALIDDDATAPDGYQYRTKHGTFSGAVLSQCRVRMTSEDGELRLLLPIRLPWLRRPNPKADTEEGRCGERAEPIYAATAEERMRIANQRDEAARTSSPRERWGVT